jgi:hypothetical protein
MGQTITPLKPHFVFSSRFPPCPQAPVKESRQGCAASEGQGAGSTAQKLQKLRRHRCRIEQDGGVDVRDSGPTHSFV